MSEKLKVTCVDGKDHQIIYLGMVRGHACSRCGRTLVNLNSDRALVERVETLVPGRKKETT